jgi:amino acid transporter
MSTDIVDGSGRPQEVPGPFGAPVPEGEVEATLRADELNLFDSTAVAVSSVAPAYSLASTLGFIFVITGIAYAGPALMIVAFVPVLFIAVAYFHLNRRHPHAGASYAWLAKLVHPTVGWYNGWIQVTTSVIFCVAAPFLAGQYTLQLFNSLGWISDASANNVWYTTFTASLFLAFVTFICIYGIRWTTNLQWILVLIEYIAVLAFSIGGIIKVAVSHPKGSTSFHAGWFWPGNIQGYAALAAGAALAVFFFWGWDTTVNLSEESKESNKIPGQAAIISMFLLLFVFVLNFVAVEMLVPADQIANQGGNILFYFGEQFAGSWAKYVMIFAVITSTIATTQTTLLPAARISFAMSRDGVFPKLFGTIHPKFKTPATGTVVLAFLALIGMYGIVTFDNAANVTNILGYLITDLGVLVAIYYGATGLACAWAFRKAAFQKTSFFFTGILLPALAGLFMFWVGFEVIRQNWGSHMAPAVVVVALGIPLVVVAAVTSKSDFFKTKPIAYTSIEE